MGLLSRLLVILPRHLLLLLRFPISSYLLASSPCSFLFLVPHLVSSFLPSSSLLSLYFSLSSFDFLLSSPPPTHFFPFCSSSSSHHPYFCSSFYQHIPSLPNPYGLLRCLPAILLFHHIRGALFFNKTGIYTVSLTCYFLHFPLHLLNYLSSRITLTHLSISCLYIVTRVLIISKRSPYMTFISPWVGTSTRSIPPETKHGDMTNYTPVKITTYSCTPGTTVRELEINPLFRLAYPFADEVTVLIFELVLKD